MYGLGGGGEGAGLSDIGFEQKMKMVRLIFMFASCINNIKYFIAQLMHSFLQIVGLLKTH